MPDPVARTAITVYPAIDLKAGRCVRLRRGDMADATVYNDDPAAQAQAFVAAGFQWLHVVDLDGAFAGRSENTAAVRAIIAAVGPRVPVQLGGGIRDRAAIDAWLAAGVSRVILGSVALNNPTLVREACRALPGRIVIGIDARDGRVATEGWAETSTVPAEDLARAYAGAGAEALIHTDIARDGMLGGANIAASESLALACGLPVIVSGGIASAAGIAAVRAAAARTGGGIAGVIVGRALYDGHVTPAEALAAARPAPPPPGKGPG